MSDVPQTPPTELADDAVVLDVREQDEWDLGHAPNAVHIPLGHLAARVDELPQIEGPLPVTCKGGGRSARAVAWLTQQGFLATNVDGGMTAWAGAGKQMVAAGDAVPRVK